MSLMKNRKINIYLSLLILVVLSFACSDQFEEPSSPTGTTLADLAEANADLDIFSAAMAKTNLLNSLDNLNSGEYTVFAPHDSAFLAYFKTIATIPNIATYTEDSVVKFIDKMTTTSALTIGNLAARLNYYVVSSRIGGILPITFSTLSGQRLSLSSLTTFGPFVYINANINPNGTYSNASGAKILSSEMGALGIIYTVNKVFSGPSSVNLPSTLSLFTPALTVSYAVNPALIGGGSETGGDATGTDYDILAYALRKTGLATTLLPNVSPLPEFTLFAPTDDAFRAYLGDLAPSTIDLENAAIQLLKARPVDELTSMIKYHIVSGRRLSTDLMDGHILTSLSLDKPFSVNKTGGTLTITDSMGGTATITSANVLTNAGVLHRLDRVLQ
jgi:uncharacterized surface protein with fasciclin (FAS1) repeats